MSINEILANATCNVLHIYTLLMNIWITVHVCMYVYTSVSL